MPETKYKSLRQFSKPLKFLGIFLGIFLGSSTGCGLSSTNGYEYPEDFDNFPDTLKVSLLTPYISPDSLARLICEASLKSIFKDRVVGFAIDSLNDAVLKAYVSYPDSAKVIFGEEIVRYSESLPWRERVTLYYLAGKKDPYRLGYKMGKNYAETSIPDSTQNREINIIQEISDSVFFHKFMIGMRNGLKNL